MKGDLVPRPLPMKAQLHLAYEDNAKLRSRIAALEAQLAELEAENEQLTKDVEFFKQQFNDQVESREELDARTGAVKALEWDGNDAKTSFGMYQVQRLDDKWEPLRDGYYMLPRRHGVVEAFDTADDAKAAAQADYERRILSALEPAAPEGQQPAACDPTSEIKRLREALLQCRDRAESGGRRIETAMDACEDISEIATCALPPEGWQVTTRPSEQAVTEAGKGLLRIVEEIDGAMNHGAWRDKNGMRLKDTPEWVAFYNALKAAMEAGG